MLLRSGLPVLFPASMTIPLFLAKSSMRDTLSFYSPMAIFVNNNSLLLAKNTGLHVQTGKFLYMACPLCTQQAGDDPNSSIKQQIGRGQHFNRTEQRQQGSHYQTH